MFLRFLIINNIVHVCILDHIDRILVSSIDINIPVTMITATAAPFTLNKISRNKSTASRFGKY